MSIRKHWYLRLFLVMGAGYLAASHYKYHMATMVTYTIAMVSAMVYVYKDIMERRAENKASKLAASTRPNDPCYCGSGKKYKKCCLNK